MVMASSYFSSQFVTLFRGSFKCTVAFQRFSLYLVSGIDVTKEDRRQKTPRHLVLWLRSSKKQNGSGSNVLHWPVWWKGRYNFFWHLTFESGKDSRTKGTCSPRS